jgi:RNA polymerase sigma factor (sigma-70 family)
LIADKQVDAARLIERAKRGDSTAWGQLVQRYSSLVYSVPARMKMNSDDCADVFQATFIALSASINRIENAVALPKWLAVTASREALRLKRISGRGGGTTPLDDMDLDTLIADEELRADQMAVQSADAHMVREALAKLPEKCRRLLTLLFLEEGLSYNEISETSGVPVGAIGPTRARCLEKLKKALGEDGFF